MLQLNSFSLLKKNDEPKEVIPRWAYKKHSFPNKKSS